MKTELRKLIDAEEIIKASIKASKHYIYDDDWVADTKIEIEKAIEILKSF